MNSFFTCKNELEGKVKIGKIPLELTSFLDNITKEYYNLIYNKDITTYHIWYNGMIPSIKSNIKQLKIIIFGIIYVIIIKNV